MTSCMDVYRAKIQSDGIIDNLKLKIVVRGDLHNEELVGDTWSPKSSMRTLKYFLADAVKHKIRVHQLDFIGALSQAKVRIGYLCSWIVYMQTILQNIQVTLIEP